MRARAAKVPSSVIINRRVARLTATFCCIVEMEATGWSGSSACTSRLTAATTEKGSPVATRISRVFSSCGYWAAQKYICGKFNFSTLFSPGASLRVRGTTPTIVIGGGCFFSSVWLSSICCPIGSFPGKYRRAKLSSMITERGAPEKPSRIGAGR